MGWFELVAAFMGFFLTHSIPVRPSVKARLVSRFGKRWFTTLYSLLSLGALTWLIGAAGRAPFVPLWDQLVWHKHLALLGMLAVFLIVAMAIGRPNPFSFGGPDIGFDPQSPGLARWMRHPLLIALALWSGLHLLVNGDLAHALVFGSFTLFALLGQLLIDRRKRRNMGAHWHDLLAHTKAAPSIQRPTSLAQFAIRLLIGLLLYGVMIWLHPLLFGVSPLS